MDNIKLDFRFANEDDAEELASFVNDAHVIECADSPASISTGFEFRKSAPKLHVHELVSDLRGMGTRWMVLETPLPDEVIVAAARLQPVTRSSNRDSLAVSAALSRIDIICAAGQNDETKSKLLRQLLTKVEHVVYNTSSVSTGAVGVARCGLVVEVPQWRVDMEQVLIAAGYDERSGFMWPEQRETELLRPTMVLEFYKTWNGRSGTGGYSAMNNDDGVGTKEHPLFATTTTFQSPLSASSSSSSSSAHADVITALDQFNIGGSNSDIEVVSVSAEAFHSAITSSTTATSSTAPPPPPPEIESAAAAAKGTVTVNNAINDSGSSNSGSNVASEGAGVDDMEAIIGTLFRALHAEYGTEGH